MAAESDRSIGSPALGDVLEAMRHRKIIELDASLRFATSRRDFDTCIFLLERRASPFALGPDGESALHIAARDGSVDLCETFLECRRSPGSDRDRLLVPASGTLSPLHLAALFGHSRIVSIIAESWTDACRPTAQTLAECLVLAAYRGYPDTCDVLSEFGADPHAPVSISFLLASLRPYSMAVLDLGLDDTVRARLACERLFGAAESACTSRSTAVATALRSLTAILSISASANISALSAAAWQGHVSACHALLRHTSLFPESMSAHVESVTPLVAAALRNRTDICALLLSHGAVPGADALVAAAAAGHTPTLEAVGRVFAVSEPAPEASDRPLTADEPAARMLPARLQLTSTTRAVPPALGMGLGSLYKTLDPYYVPSPASDESTPTPSPLSPRSRLFSASLSVQRALPPGYRDALDAALIVGASIARVDAMGVLLRLGAVPCPAALCAAAAATAASSAVELLLARGAVVAAPCADLTGPLLGARALLGEPLTAVDVAAATAPVAACVTMLRRRLAAERRAAVGWPSAQLLRLPSDALTALLRRLRRSSVDMPVPRAADAVISDTAPTAVTASAALPLVLVAAGAVDAPTRLRRLMLRPVTVRVCAAVAAAAAAATVFASRQFQKQ
jgi:ankyrin repeat protein